MITIQINDQPIRDMGNFAVSKANDAADKINQRINQVKKSTNLTPAKAAYYASCLVSVSSVAHGYFFNPVTLAATAFTLRSLADVNNKFDKNNKLSLKEKEYAETAVDNLRANFIATSILGYPMIGAVWTTLNALKGHIQVIVD